MRTALTTLVPFLTLPLHAAAGNEITLPDRPGQRVRLAPDDFRLANQATHTWSFTAAPGLTWRPGPRTSRPPYRPRSELAFRCRL